MKIGIIIIFHNNEKDINTHFFVEHLNEAKNLELCLVNNASRDKTYQILKDIRALCLNTITIVDIKKFKSDVFAIRSGARFMFNQFDLKHVGFVNANQLNNYMPCINNIITSITKHQDILVKYNSEVLEKKEMKQTLFKSIFSITESLEILKNDHQLIDLS
ncbi:family 2 glycosyl transferase [Hyunsoonleella sp. 2307UL5-6]|uniref:family 2 glycosyl transferase n=1 Tax=Hyunsoonleella sp. 2307UL5-6 TaxID=3384768 RepID=UPI0039BCD2D8